MRILILIRAEATAINVYWINEWMLRRKKVSKYIQFVFNMQSVLAEWGRVERSLVPQKNNTASKASCNRSLS